MVKYSFCTVLSKYNRKDDKRRERIPCTIWSLVSHICIHIASASGNTLLLCLIFSKQNQPKESNRDREEARIQRDIGWGGEEGVRRVRRGWGGGEEGVRRVRDEGWGMRGEGWYVISHSTLQSVYTMFQSSRCSPKNYSIQELMPVYSINYLNFLFTIII